MVFEVADGCCVVNGILVVQFAGSELEGGLCLLG